MPDTQLPDPQYLRQRLRYNPETGNLYWLAQSGDGRNWVASWNTRYAEKEAFTADMHGYQQGRIDGINLLKHRVVWASMKGYWPADALDHVNGNPKDNRIENLREVDSGTNSRNVSVRRASTTSVIGVTWDSQTGRYRAQITHRGQLVHLGRFDTIEEAAGVRKAAERQYGFHENHGRKQQDKEVSGSSAS